MQLKPGVSPAYFWSVIGIGAASTAATALSLTTYAWAGMAGALIALIVGFWQANGPKGPPNGAQILISCLALLSLSSCAPFTAFMASPAGQATLALADLGLNVAAAKGKISAGDNVAIQRGLAIVTNPADPTSLKVFSLAELGLNTAVSKGVIKQGDALIIQEAGVIIKNAVIQPQPVEPKQPVKVLPATASRSGQECPRSSPARPACMLMASREFRHAATAANDAQGEPVMPPRRLPVMKQSAGGVSIPSYGAVVAAHLASAD